MGLLTNNKLLTETESIARKDSVPAQKSKVNAAPSVNAAAKTGAAPNVPVKKYRRSVSAQRSAVREQRVLTDSRSVQKTTAKKPREVRSTPVRFIPLGGLNEIGKNLYVYECSNDMFIVDCGLTFPDAEMPGVDLVVPDFTYLEKNKEHFRGIIITHGHEDHIGALPYLLKKVNVPIYGTRLTLGLVEG